MADKTPSKTLWNDDQNFKFTMEIIERGGPGGKTWSDVAKKWGPPHTTGSLSMRWSRMKKRWDQLEGKIDVDKNGGAAEGKKGKKRSNSNAEEAKTTLKKAKKEPAVKVEVDDEDV